MIFPTVYVIISLIASVKCVEQYRFTFTLETYDSKGILTDGSKCDPWPVAKCDLGFNVCVHEFTTLQDANNFGFCPDGYKDTKEVTSNNNVFTFGKQAYGNVVNPLITLGISSWKGMVVKVKSYDVDSIGGNDDVDFTKVIFQSDLPLTQNSIIAQGTRKSNPSDLTYSVDIECINGYKSNQCQCLPRNDDTNGHFSCNTDGSISCLTNYYDVTTNCKVQCLPDTNSPAHYTCDTNGQKICSTGYIPQNDCTQCADGYYIDGSNCYLVTTTVPTTQVPITAASTTMASTTEALTTVAPTTRAPTSEPPTTVAPTTVVPTTLAPTTVAPTTRAPTTEPPTTVAPTTVVPTTLAPITVAPTTRAPTTEPPTTVARTTVVPTALAPTTVAPTTRAPTTEPPTTVAPTTVVPTTLAPTTVAPTTRAPTTEPPTTVAPTTVVPTTLAPITVTPTTRAPTTEPPTTVAPTTVVPTTLAPTTVAPTTRAPTTEPPTTVAPTTVVPTTLAPTTVAPTTRAPTTEPPTTVAPTTVVPTTLAPTTVAPTTRAPTTEPPTTVAPTTGVPTTLAPTTVAPTTRAPTTEPPTTVAPTTVVPTTVVPTTLAPTTVAPTQVPTSAVLTDGPPIDCSGSLFKCKPGEDGDVSDPLCPCATYYFTCVSGITYQRKCPPGNTGSLVYNIRKGVCDYFYNVPVCNGRDLPTMSPTIAAATTEATTIMEGTTTKMNPATASNITSTEAASTNALTTQAADCSGNGFICPDGDNGVYEDPQCPCPNYYFQCSDGMAYKMKCPTSLVFNGSKEYCDFPYNIPGCSVQ